jgi:hypothetical protein
MPLNTILANSEAVSIKDQKIVGQTTSRNLKISASEYLSTQAFQFTFKPNSYMRYSQNRDLLSELRVADKVQEQYLNFGTTGWASYIKYQGNMTSGQISACQWDITSSGKNLVLGNLPSISSTAYIVKAGDFCQVGRYSYIATASVQRGSGTTVTIPVHRSLLETLVSPINAVIGEYGTTVSMGGDTYTGVTFPVLLNEYPIYTFVPIYNDSFIAWNGDFEAFEAIL